MTKQKLSGIERVEAIIEHANTQQYAHHSMENYLQAIAETQLLILKKLKKKP